MQVQASKRLERMSGKRGLAESNLTYRDMQPCSYTSLRTPRDAKKLAREQLTIIM